MKPHQESKDERFHRLAEKRVNRILHFYRLLGNLSWTGTYSYSSEQVEQIFTTLQMELIKAKMRFLQAQKQGKKRFSLSEPYVLADSSIRAENPSFAIPLPDGTYLRAVGFPTSDYPSINIYWDNGINSPDEALCFVEYNSGNEDNRRVCVGTYRGDEEETSYYEPYIPAERNSTNE